jgi:hypothetical protein
LNRSKWADFLWLEVVLVLVVVVVVVVVIFFCASVYSVLRFDGNYLEIKFMRCAW